MGGDAPYGTPGKLGKILLRLNATKGHSKNLKGLDNPQPTSVEFTIVNFIEKCSTTKWPGGVFRDILTYQKNNTKHLKI